MKFYLLNRMKEAQTPSSEVNMDHSDTGYLYDLMDNKNITP